MEYGWMNLCPLPTVTTKTEDKKQSNATGLSMEGDIFLFSTVAIN
jgi:hypothetical protein